MKNRMKYMLASLLLAGTAFEGQSADFFSTAEPETLFNFGVRVGVNTSNRNVDKGVFDIWNRNAWGTGFNAGAIVDINFREWFSIQPGFFFDSRSGSWAYSSYTTVNGSDVVMDQFGKGRTYNFNIPILASFHFNVTEGVKWNVEVGPYFQLKLKSEFNDAFTYDIVSGRNQLYGTGRSKTFDFGLKIGTSLDILRHYNVGVHYLAGCLDAWSPSVLGGRNKEWVFTIGYNF